MVGQAAFNLYAKIKAAEPDIDDWLTEVVAHEYGYELADIIQAVSVCTTTQAPWEDVDVFQNVVLVLNGRPVFGDMLQDITIKEIAYAVLCLKRQFPDENFNDDVAKYIAFEAIEDGLMFLPDILKFAQSHITIENLNEDQRAMQRLYMQEIMDYVAAADSVATINLEG